MVYFQTNYILDKISYQGTNVHLHFDPGGGTQDFYDGVIMSGHFLRPPNMLTKFSEIPKNYVDHFFKKLLFIDNSVLEHFSLKRPTH